MPWEPLVRSQASFRGVPFEVDTSERGGGRRGVTNEYPFRDEPFREDLGRAVRTFTVEGHVIGPEYLTARDRLIAALESPFGPGQLAHPYYGTRNVVVTAFRIRESATEGGLARFSIDFEESPAAPVQPAATVDRPVVLRSQAATARAAVRAEFTSTYAPGVHPESLAGALSSAAGAVDAVLQASGQSVQEAAASAKRAAAVAANAAALVTSGAETADALAELYSAASGLTSSAMLATYSANLGQRPSGVTVNRVAERENFDAIQRLSQRLAVVRAAELALDEVFPDYGSAVATRDSIVELLDEQAALAEDAAYTALVELRAALVNAVPGFESGLPRLVTYTPPETAPSLVLAWRLYRSVTLERDVLARNRIPNPMFVVGGTPLEVLSDG